MALLTPDWQRAIALLDAGLALPADAREGWLDQMAAQEPGALPLLRKLLAAHGRVQTHELLATLPKLLRDPQTADSGSAGMQVGPFELLQPLGRGGMGSVWRARYADARLKRDVAVKLPASTDDPVALRTLRERFARERDFLAQLQHPHIARLYDAGVSESGQPYLAMEYVAGTAIDTYCDAQRLPVKARLQLFLQVLDAVAYAHQQLVLHRDLKAGNVLVDNAGQVRLLDFGVARLLPPTAAPLPALLSVPDAAGENLSVDAVAVENDAGRAPKAAEPTGADLTERAGAAFTLGYAAPEQVNHGALSTATDVYALGVMLYRLLTGLSPYQPSRDSRGALEDAVLLATPAAASTRIFSAEVLAARACDAQALRKALRDDLDVILAKALKKSPTERYTTVTALADDLRRHLAQQPISARPDSWWYRSSRFVARHRVAVAASALASAALVATASVAAWQAHVSARNAELAQKEAARANTAQKFFAGLLSNADPEKNKHITALDRKLADQALARAEVDFADSPETLLLVLKQLGDIYNNLGDSNSYLLVQKRRVALLAAQPQATADEKVEATVELGNAMGNSKQLHERAQAAAVLLSAHESALKWGASDALVVLALGRIADQYLSEWKYVDADRYASLAVAHAERSLPKMHPTLAYAYVQKGLTATKQGDFELARAVYRSAIAIDDSGAGRGKVSQLSTRLQLVNTEYLAGNYVSAKREALAGLAFAQQHLAPTAGGLAPLRRFAVLASERAGDLDEAWGLVAHLLGSDMNASDRTVAGLAHYVKGVVALARRDFAVAAEALATAKVALADDSRTRLGLATQLAFLGLRTGGAQAVVDELTPIVQRAKVESGTGGEEYSRLAEAYGVALARVGKLNEARQQFENGCAWRLVALRADHPNRIRCQAYVILSSPERSAPVAKRGLDVLVQVIKGRDEKTGLLKPLEAALASVGAIKQARFLDFPILD